MSFEEAVHQILQGIRQTGWVEFIAVLSGILSVYFSRRENVLVYPVGLINTVFYIYISFKSHLLGEGAVNIYYTLMSLYGWILWTKKDKNHQPAVKIQYSNKKEKISQLTFFFLMFILIFAALNLLKKNFAEGAIPWADSLASSTAFTGMYLMARKKVESWYWWIATNITSIPLFFVKGYVFTSVYFFILLIMAFGGLTAWQRKAKLNES